MSRQVLSPDKTPLTALTLELLCLVGIRVHVGGLLSSSCGSQGCNRRHFLDAM